MYFGLSFKRICTFRWPIGSGRQNCSTNDKKSQVEHSFSDPSDLVLPISKYRSFEKLIIFNAELSNFIYLFLSLHLILISLLSHQCCGSGRLLSGSDLEVQILNKK